MAVSVVACGGNDVSDSPLVGQWSWIEGADYVYTFEADGTGSRGIPGQMETFNWSIPGDGRLRISGTGIAAEQWNYTITGDTLRIDSRQVSGLTFSYTRVG